MKPSGMQTSAGIADDEIDRTGRSAHPLFAAAAGGNRTIQHIACLTSNLLSIENDYNRRYCSRSVVWFPDVISARWLWPAFLYPPHGARPACKSASRPTAS